MGSVSRPVGNPVNWNVGYSVGVGKYGLPYPVTLNPVLYLSRTNGKFQTSENGVTYVKKWIDPYSGLEATQDTGDYRPELVADGVKFDGDDDGLELPKTLGLKLNTFSISFIINTSITNSAWLYGVRNVDAQPRIECRLNHSDYSFGNIFFEVRDDDNNRFQVVIDQDVGIYDGLNHHVVYKFDSQNNIAKILIDGIFHSFDIVYQQSPFNFIAFDRYLYLGGFNNGTLLSPYDGIVDEFIFYDYLLSDNQMYNIYNYTK